MCIPHQKYNMNEKTCKHCGETKPIEFFGLKYNKKQPNARRSYCKKCESLRTRKRSKIKRQTMKDQAVEYLGGGCSNPNCPIKHLNLGTWILDFHHIGNKNQEISRLMKRYVPLDRIKEELDKCVLLCVLCHRMEHMKTNES